MTTKRVLGRDLAVGDVVMTGRNRVRRLTDKKPWTSCGYQQFSTSSIDGKCVGEIHIRLDAVLTVVAP